MDFRARLEALSELLKQTHELDRVLALLAPRTQAIRQAVDICGGMGHLARLCVKTFNIALIADVEACFVPLGERDLSVSAPR